MVNTTVKYIVYSHNGGGVRHHHFGIQNNIIDEADGHASPGDTINALGFPTLSFNGSILPFAFMSVHGAADGNHLYTTPGNQPVSVGNDNVDILVVYAPAGGIGSGGGPGVWVDAFNVDTGNFSDSLDFIKVLTPPTPPDTLDAAKTTYSNQEGDVSTVTAENIRANQYVDGVPFLEWKRIVPTPFIVGTPQIGLAQNESGEIWFAFYQTTASQGGGIPTIVRAALEQGIFVWTGDDTCGNGGHYIGPRGGGPGPGPGAFRISLKKDVVARLSADQQKRLSVLTNEYPEIAGTALTAMAKVLTILNGVNEIVSGSAGKQAKVL